MADRKRLHIEKLDDLKVWLEKTGWNIEEPKGEYEVLRARKTDRQNPLIIYTKANAKEHLSVMDRDSDIIDAFLRDSRKQVKNPKTKADEIRSMSDEELLEFLLSFKACEYCRDYHACSFYKPGEYRDPNECKLFKRNGLYNWLKAICDEK